MDGGEAVWTHCPQPLGSQVRSARDCDENELQAGSVRSVSDAVYDKPGGVERLNDFGALSEAEGRVGREYGTIRREDERRPERDKRGVDLDKVTPRLDRADLWQFHFPVLASPLPPCLPRRVTSLEH